MNNFYLSTYSTYFLDFYTFKFCTDHCNAIVSIENISIYIMSNWMFLEFSSWMLNRIRGSRVTLHCRLMGSDESSNFLSGLGFDRVCKTVTQSYEINGIQSSNVTVNNKPRLMPGRNAIWLFPINFDGNYYLFVRS